MRYSYGISYGISYGSSIAPARYIHIHSSTAQSLPAKNLTAASCANSLSCFVMFTQRVYCIEDTLQRVKNEFEYTGESNICLNVCIV